MIFDEATLRKINRLTLVANQVRAGMMKGERRSSKRGASLEFADYRDYTPGDDLRRLDWNAYARLDRPFLKLFEEEEDLAVHILVDASQSMDWGAGEAHKFRYAIRLAAALGSIALSTGDRLTAVTLHGAQTGPAFGPTRGPQNTLRLLEFLEAQKASGATDLNRALRDYALAAHRPGLAVLLSDLLSVDGYENGLGQLQSRGFEVAVLHLLSPDELEPPLAGDLRLVDVETGQTQEVSLDSGLRQQYRQRVEDWRAEIQAWCRRRGIRCLPVNTDTSWEKVVLQELRQAGMVR